MIKNEKVSSGDATNASSATCNNIISNSIKAVSNLNAITGVPYNTYVIEECSELIKVLMKKERGKQNDLDIVDEACDVLTTVLSYLHLMGISEKDIENQIVLKCNRALERFEKNKEV